MELPLCWIAPLLGIIVFMSWLTFLMKESLFTGPMDTVFPMQFYLSFVGLTVSSALMIAGALGLLARSKPGTRMTGGALLSVSEPSPAGIGFLDPSDNRYAILDGLFESFPGVFYLFDRNARLLRWNRNFEMRLGYTADEVANSRPLDFIPAEERGWIDAKILEAFDTGNACVESDLLAKDGARIPFLLTWARTRFGGTDCLVGAGFDLTERKLTEDKLHRLAHYDPLTELPNRLLFYDRLCRALAFASRYGRELAVLFVDLDFFKEVNDRYGHSAGDTVLRQTAWRIASCLRESDTVARVGGDEFLVLLPEICGPGEAQVVVEKILDSLSHPVSADGFTAFVSASVGVAVFPGDGVDEESLIKAADYAMYRSKSARRSIRPFTPESRLPVVRLS